MSDAPITIRSLGLEDYEAMCAVWAASGLGYQPNGRESRQSIARQQAIGVQTILGAFKGDRLAGLTVITHDGRKGWINRLAVHPDFQRQGVARELIHAGEKLLHDLGLTVIAVLVEHDNPASFALFKSEGYHVHETYYLTKRDRPDA